MLIFCIIILVAGSISGITALIFVIKELTDDEEDFLLIKAFVFGALTILLLGVGIPCTILGPQEYNTVIHTVQNDLSHITLAFKALPSGLPVDTVRQ